MEVSLYPAWRQAESDLLARGIAPGMVIESVWLRDAFGIKEAKTIAEHQRNELLFLQQMTSLRESLLERHKVMLRPVPGVGYAVVRPEMQTAIAMHTRLREIKRSFRHLGAELQHVQTDKLTDGQRKENSDAIAKVAALSALFRGGLAQVGSK
jgi:hypothetical protein